MESIEPASNEVPVDTEGTQTLGDTKNNKRGIVTFFKSIFKKRAMVEVDAVKENQQGVMTKIRNGAKKLYHKLRKTGEGVGASSSATLAM